MKYGNPFKALYRGDCHDCGKKIQPGQLCRFRLIGESKAICHVYCDEAQIEPTVGDESDGEI